MQMGALQLINVFEDTYKGLSQLYPWCSCTRPQQYVEGEVCQNLDGYLHAKKAARVNSSIGEHMRGLLHIRQAYW